MKTGQVHLPNGNTVAGFIGWLSADIPELRGVEVPRLAASYDRFLERLEQDRASADGMPTAPETIDQAHERLGHTAPRVTLADLDANIVDVEIVKHVAKSGQTLRWAVLTLRNGFALAGEPSASVSPENDSAELGEKFAIENARRALWPLMGYALREKLAATPPKGRPTIAELEKLLRSEDDRPVTILPNGEIRVDER